MEEKSYSRLKEVLISNSLIIFLIPIIAYILSYGYNLGYNSYFKIPAYLTNFSFALILKNLMNNYIVIIGVLFIVFFIVFIYHIINQHKPSLKKHINKVFDCLLCLLMFLLLVLSIYVKSYICVLMLVIIASLCYYYYSLNKDVRKLDDMIKTSPVDEESIIEFKDEVNRIRNKIRIPFFKTFVAALVIIAILIVLYIAIFLLGYKNASEEKEFYVINNNNIVINSYNDNYITVPIYSNKTTSYFKPIFTITPISGTSIELLHIPNLNPEINDD